MPDEPQDLPTTRTDGVTPDVGDVSELVRVGTVLSTLLDETRRIQLDEAARDRLGTIYRQALATIRENVSPELQDELEGFAPPLGNGSPSEADLRIAQASLTGWLSGLFSGLQAALAGRIAGQQLAQARPGPAAELPERSGQYL